MARAGFSSRTGKIARVVGIAAIVIAFLGATLARYDIVPKLPGFGAITLGILLAMIGAVLALVSIAVGYGQKDVSHKPAVIGLFASGAFLALIASYVIPASGYPAIHDATTDLANPPEFQTLSLREDNLTGVGTIENWRKIHAEAFPDLKPVTISKPVAEVIADAKRLVEQRGWTLAAADPEAGRLEATAYAAYIRFKDDIVLRVRPAAEEGSSVVDMRSVSRVGGGDLGYNANRVRAFLKDLQAQ